MFPESGLISGASMYLDICI